MSSAAQGVDLCVMGFKGEQTVTQVAEVAVGPLPVPTNYSVLLTSDWNSRPVNQVEYQA